MRLALLHRRLAVLMGLAALVAFSAGAGMAPLMWLATAGMAVALLWHPPAAAAVWIERIGWAGAVALFGWVVYVALVVGGDYLPPILGFLLFLLVTESLRPVEVRNDLRVYALSFALLIASTAYYPGVVFGLAFVAYLGLATLALMVGHLRRQAEQHRLADIRLRRQFLVATAALSAITVLMSALVFAAFPRLPRGWIGVNRVAGQSSIVGFGDGVSLGQHGGRIYANPEIAFRVEFADPPPADLGSLRWRGRSYDHFDGVRWTRTRNLPPASPPPTLYSQRWRSGSARQYQIFGGPPGVRVLFGLHPVIDVMPRTPMRPWLDTTGDLVYSGGDSPVYSVRSGAPSPDPQALWAARGDEPLAASYYLQLPPLAPRIWQLADSLQRGAPSRYDAALSVERWLRQEFGYTLDLPRTAREATLEHFLFGRREGHCEYFSTAMVMLLRARGIPARNVTGFLGGEWHSSAHYLAVTQNDAHSWVEVWFPGFGWVPFDPTPAGSRNLVAGAGANPAWTWPILFWIDGMQHRWHKWVLYYDLEKQINAFRHVSGVFSRNTAVLGELTGRREFGGIWIWLIGGVAVAGVAWLLRPGLQGRRRSSAETRMLLALSRAYARAGYSPHSGRTPLEWLEALRAQGAPALDDAERLTALYLRARFGGEDIGSPGRGAMADHLIAVRRTLRKRRVRHLPRVTTSTSG
jgi:protein-glutamine gamma-glutamyltransferase